MFPQELVNPNIMNKIDKLLDKHNQYLDKLLDQATEQTRKYMESKAKKITKILRKKYKGKIVNCICSDTNGDDLFFNDKLLDIKVIEEYLKYYTYLTFMHHGKPETVMLEIIKYVEEE